MEIEGRYAQSKTCQFCGSRISSTQFERIMEKSSFYVQPLTAVQDVSTKQMEFHRTKTTGAESRIGTLKEVLQIET